VKIIDQKFQNKNSERVEYARKHSLF